MDILFLIMLGLGIFLWFFGLITLVEKTDDGVGWFAGYWTFGFMFPLIWACSMHEIFKA